MIQGNYWHTFVFLFSVAGLQMDRNGHKANADAKLEIRAGVSFLS